MKGGRTFLRRILNELHNLRMPSHKLILSTAFKLDIAWWLKYMAMFNGTHKFVDHRPITSVHIDASNPASGIYYEGDWQHTSWHHDWPLIYTDSQVAMANNNHGTSTNPLVMSALHELFWISVLFNFHIQAKYIPGKDNHIPDAISRLHQPGQLQRLHYLLAQQGVCPQAFLPTLHTHMSYKALSNLNPQIQNYANSNVNWTLKLPPPSHHMPLTAGPT